MMTTYDFCMSNVKPNSSMLLRYLFSDRKAVEMLITSHSWHNDKISLNRAQGKFNEIL